MMKWFLYIVWLMIFAPRLSSAKDISVKGGSTLYQTYLSLSVIVTLQRDTALLKGNRQHPTEEEKKKIKEVARSKKMPKPVKVDDAGTAKEKPKPRRQRRPDGLVRPPEIPRRNNN